MATAAAIRRHAANWNCHKAHSVVMGSRNTFDAWTRMTAPSNIPLARTRDQAGRLPKRIVMYTHHRNRNVKMGSDNNSPEYNNDVGNIVHTAAASHAVRSLKHSRAIPKTSKTERALNRQ